MCPDYIKFIKIGFFRHCNSGRESFLNTIKPIPERPEECEGSKAWSNAQDSEVRHLRTSASWLGNPVP